MYQAAITTICHSIFPTFFELRRDNIIQLGVSGTGFFITNQGHFLTACHVVTDVPAGSRLLYAGNVPYTPLTAPIQIEELARDERMDLYVGRVPSNALAPLRFSDQEARPGKLVCLSGYPLARLARDSNDSINVSNVRPYWQLTFVIDGLSADINNREYRGFITQHTSLRGMSGGPVFDVEGLVFGVDVATLNRAIPEPDGRQTDVPNGVVVNVARIREITRNLPLV